MKGILKANKNYLILFFILVSLVFLYSCGGVTPTGYTITATAGTGGSINPSGAVAVTEGSNLTFTITPYEGYEISDVLVDGTSEGAVTSYTFPNIQQNHTIQVSFTGLGVYNTHTGLSYDTIQEAIDASLDGETILVYPGNYYENINFNARNITVRSTDPSDPAIVSATIIDGGGNDSVVKFTGADTSTLEGFTIQNGDATFGGGILVFVGSPTITSNAITGNKATVMGGGIYVEGLPTITNNSIMGNTAKKNGGGIYVSSISSPVIGGTDVADIGNFNTICGNFNTISGNIPNQIEPNNYPNNYITTICMTELDFQIETDNIFMLSNEWYPVLCECREENISILFETRSFEI